MNWEKTIKAIMAVVLLAVCVSAQADKKVTVKANDGSTGKFHLSSRIVIDLTKEKPVVRNNNGSTVFQPDAEFVLQIDGDLEDGIKSTKQDNRKDVIYDLSGRKVTRPAKGIYIKDGKKVVLK